MRGAARADLGGWPPCTGFAGRRVPERANRTGTVGWKPADAVRPDRVELLRLGSVGDEPTGYHLRGRRRASAEEQLSDVWETRSNIELVGAPTSNFGCDDGTDLGSAGAVEVVTHE